MTRRGLTAVVALLSTTTGCTLQNGPKSEKTAQKAEKLLLRPISISDDGYLLAIADNSGSIRIWDWRAGHVIASVDGGSSAEKSAPAPPTDTAEPSSSQSGKKLSVKDRLKTLFTGASKRAASRVNGFLNQSAIQSAFFDAPYNREGLTGAWIPYWKRSSFSPDRKHLALAGLEEVNLFDTTHGSFERRFSGSHQEIAFSPDTKYMISVSGNTADLWELLAFRKLSTLTASWNPPDESSAFAIGGGLYTAAFSAGGTSIAVADKMEVHGHYGSATTERVRIWDLSAILGVHPSGSDATWIKKVVPTRIDRAQEDTTASLTLFPEGFPRRRGNPFPPEAPNVLMTYSPGDRYLAATTSDELRLWELRGKKKGDLRTISFRRTRPAEPQNVLGDVTSLEFSKDERLVGVGVGNRALVWDVMTGDVRYEFQAEGTTWVSIHFQPTGEIVAIELPYAASTIRIWDVKTHTEKAQLP